MDAFNREDLCAQTQTLVLAGGRGERLAPLTKDRTKGAVPFAGSYRLIDFTLSNCLHSGLRRIAVLPQYKYASLERHLRLGWNLFRAEWGRSWRCCRRSCAAAMAGTRARPMPSTRMPTRSDSAPYPRRWCCLPTTSTEWTTPGCWIFTSAPVPS